LTLKDARSKANELRAEIERGADPHGDKIVARRRSAAVDESFEAVARRVVAEHQFRKNRSWEWAAPLLGLGGDLGAKAEQKPCPPLPVVRDGSKDPRGRRRPSPAARGGPRRLSAITRADVIAALDQISADTPIMANRMLAVLGKLFKWAESKG